MKTFKLFIPHTRVQSIYLIIKLTHIHYKHNKCVIMFAHSNAYKNTR